MSYEIKHLYIDDQSLEGKVIDAIVKKEGVSPEEAVRKVLREYGHPTPGEQMLGALSSAEDRKILEAALKVAEEQLRIDSKRNLAI